MRVLRSGSRGPAVQFLQLALNRAGYGALETDGVFGSLTEAALRRFQGAQGLAADGVAGTQTHRKLMPWYTGFRVQTVMAGDTLWRAAQQNGVSVEALLLANPGVRPENLRIGSELVVPTLDGDVKYNIPAGTQPGDVFKLKDRGIQNLNGRGRGDQLVRVEVEVPRKLNERQKELLRAFEEDLNPGNRHNLGDDRNKGLFGNKKKK